MPCEHVQFPDGNHAVLCTGRSGSRKCKFCGQRYRGGKECDFPIGNGKTCDAAMCDNCARTLGRQDTNLGGGMIRPNDTIDVCPDHRAKAVMVGGKLQPEQGGLFADLPAEEPRHRQKDPG